MLHETHFMKKFAMGSGDNRLLGTWKLQSCIFVGAETGKQSNPLRIHPVGYLNENPQLKPQ